ncbi:TPA: flavin monoamine oxidase family protein [Stenotrophomonas maltophilia]|uniref:FAD-dependent oxidoreductase n=1 Tax=Stenotrophomonas maltophilia TaxID=40324 RepID=A0AAJ2JE26_STEMA|nr:FAD-dependent oxidoreductase [Stenotrophomonas maltophilia]MDT3468353.1 FAD-dependent oxidoreductase [Stenotrophomonas maltophilia]
MSSNRASVLIVGGGLSGLHAAWTLQSRGFHDFCIIEARERLGGRVETGVVAHLPVQGSLEAENGQSRFDLGPTWFWPEYQREFDHLLTALGLERLPQFESGHMMFERSPNDSVSRMEGFISQPTSMRVVGGMQSLIDALRKRIEDDRIVIGQKVRRIRRVAEGVELDVTDERGVPNTWAGDTVLLAVPPRLADATIGFSPPLPTELSSQWRHTATWMAPHAKYLAVYDLPFWQQDGLSGNARSAAGPMVEVHDASTSGGLSGLFGFIGVPAHVRQQVGRSELIRHCRAQLVRLFGAKAADPRQEFLKDWAVDGCTAVEADLHSPAQHGQAPDSAARSGPWENRVIGIASEWSPQYPGYLAGAVDAANAGALRALSLVGR